MKYCAFLLFCLISLTGPAQKQDPVSIVFDSDIGPDYDDVGAITMLHHLADGGEAKILATMASNRYPNAAAVLNVFNTYFKRPGIPVGIVKGKGVNLADSQHWSDTVIAKYPHRIKSNDQVADAVELYREVLSKQPDRSVTIVTVGFLTNLANLMTSRPDRFSNLDGMELIRRKVKRLVSMAGKFPEGKEFNVYMDAAASRMVFSQWPTEVIYSGFEIGEKIKTGLPLVKNRPDGDAPTRDVFRICLPMSPEDNKGRSSWDETAVLVAVRGSAPYYDLQPGHMVVNDDGSDTWDRNGKNQYYLVEKLPYQQVQDLINHLIQYPASR